MSITANYPACGLTERLHPPTHDFPAGIHPDDLADAIERRGHTIHEAAELLEVSRNTARRWLAGLGIPNPDGSQRILRYVRFARALNVHANERG